MNRSYYSNSFYNFLNEDTYKILGELVKHHNFSLEEIQRDAWLKQILILKSELKKLGNGYILFEYTIPRMGKRVDNVVIYNSFIFILEFKIGENKITKYAKDQVLDYALDLKYFHQQSEHAFLIPLVVFSESQIVEQTFKKFDDSIFEPVPCNKNNIAKTILNVANIFRPKHHISPVSWENSIYSPTPTIIEAAQALYKGHNIKEISRADSGAVNLSITTQKINEIIEEAKKLNQKAICFITGVPGAGKTLAGLNIANERHKFEENEHAVFLSGNGPLVLVLQEALAREEACAKGVSKKEALMKARAFIQNIHHFRDDALATGTPPIEKVVIFDEAQRAWDKEQTAAFMKTKRGKEDFELSEPEFLIGVMDRHKNWCVITCLIGGGQEINTGEAGLPEWFNALRKKYSHWKVYLSEKIIESEYLRENTLNEMIENLTCEVYPELHLSVSIRSFRSENVSAFVKCLLDGDNQRASKLYKSLFDKYPIHITRDINKAKAWLKSQARGTERTGIVASSNALRLKPYGIWVKNELNAADWFLNSKDDIRSSYYLEDVATEFDIQGLEIDWACVAWDADLRYEAKQWSFYKFRGTTWQTIRDGDAKMYLKNTYRVLLTRARQGLIIFIPFGNDEDFTRIRKFYDDTYNYLIETGIQEI